MSRRMRPLPTRDEWVLETLAGTARAVAKGTASQRQLDRTRDMALRWNVDPIKVETAIGNKKAPPRAGEI